MVKPMVSLMLACLGSLTNASVIKILTPPEHATIGTDYVYVVGTTSAPRVELLLNGVKVADCTTKDSMFHARVNFGYGINEITVIPLDAMSRPSIESAEQVEILYAPKPSPKYQRIYSEYSFHGSSIEPECRSCHRTDEKLEEAGDTAVVCLECHTEMQEQFQRHTKTDSRACMPCHQRQGGTAFTKGETEKSCFICHENRRGMFSQEYVHGPVASGSCRICHNPHGSQYEKSLNHPIQILCFSCHEEVEEELRKKEIHRPFVEGRCTACHDPHSTGNRWVLVKNSQEICFSCHQVGTNFDRHNHPYNIKPRHKLRIPLKLSESGQLECLSCHNPHASDGKHLLRVSQDYLCFSCHEEKR